MHTLKQWIVNNWVLKIASLFLATLLWAAVSSQSSSEIGFEVPLEYRNIPGQMEITGDVTNTVQVRLRGSSNVINGISAKDVASTVDLAGMRAGEKIVALSPHNVQAPFGAEVIRVTPSSVRFTLERTITKTVPIVLTLLGQPESGYVVGMTLVSPMAVEAEGPEGRMNTLSSIETVPVRLDRRRSSFEQVVDLDVPDPQIRLKRPSAVAVKIEIHEQ